MIQKNKVTEGAEPTPVNTRGVVTNLGQKKELNKTTLQILPTDFPVSDWLLLSGRKTNSEFWTFLRRPCSGLLRWGWKSGREGGIGGQKGGVGGGWAGVFCWPVVDVGKSGGGGSGVM